MLSLDYAGAGGGSACYVLWNGIGIEHFNRSEQLDDAMRAKLTEACTHLERLGVVPRTNSVVWHWGWFEKCPADSVYLPLLRLCPDLYEHGMTPSRQREMELANCPKYPIVEPDGSLIFVFTNTEGVKWEKDNTVSVVKLHPDDTVGWYHTMAALDYHTLIADQPVHNGPCYASYEGLVRYFEGHGFTAASVAAVLSLACSM